MQMAFEDTYKLLFNENSYLFRFSSIQIITLSSGTTELMLHASS